jgi:transcriptional regulator with XRE-family HTH domain
MSDQTGGALTGTRIRDARVARGLRQADLASRAGISAPYLNLIEHNRRRIGGRLLQDLARELAVSVEHLAEGQGGALVGALQAAAANEPAAQADAGQAADLAGRFPGWADLVLRQGRRIAALEARVAELTDRLSHDVELTGSLHDVVMAVTAIHSTASILVSEEDLDRDWQGRFHRNIHRDSTRLAEASQRLVRFLEMPGQSEEGMLSPQEEVEWLLEGLGYHFPDLEGEVAARGPEEIVAGTPLGPAAAGLLRAWLARYRADALALPLARIGPAALSCGHDPLLLAQQLDQPLARVMRRLACLPRGEGGPDLGLVVADQGGAITWLRALPGLALPRRSGSCPLWPVWAAFGQGGVPLRAEVALPGDLAPLLQAVAVAAPRHLGPGGAVMEATMLVRRGPGPGLPRISAGPGCRVCPREDCAARREPAALRKPGEVPGLSL